MRWQAYEQTFSGKAMGLRERIRMAWGILRGKQTFTFSVQYRVEPAIYFDDVSVEYGEGKP